MTSRTTTALVTMVACAGVARFGIAVYNAPPAARGDYAATLPGAYARTLNPTLWNSPDLKGSYLYQRDLYVYGPTQYLVLYPAVFLNSYAQIARALGYVYAIVLAVAIFVLARLIADRAGAFITVLPAVAGLVLLFAPTYQVYIQREFEVVVFLCLVLATYLLTKRREGWAGALMGLVTWFKLWPIAFVAYFLVKRQFRAVAAFILVSCLTLGLGQLLFGLNRFAVLNPSVSSSMGGHFILTSLIPPLERAVFISREGVDNSAVGEGFCHTWYQAEQTAVGVRWAICTLAYSHRWLPAPAVFYAIALMLGSAACLGFVLIQRRGQLSEDERRWSTICEMSLVMMGAAFMLSAHYYYFVYLTLPLTAVAYQYVRGGQWIKLGVLGGAYFLLSAFLIPLSIGSSLLGIDVWRFYIEHAVYFYGEMILMTLVLWEYMGIGLRGRAQ